MRLYLSDDNSGRIQRKVAAREVDFGLTSRWADAPGWISSRSWKTASACCTARTTPGCARRDGTVRWADLAGRQLVGVVDETGIIALLRARADLPIEAAAPFHEASSTTSQAALVKAGLGVALLPALAAERVREPGLAYALLARPTMVRTVCLIRHLDYSLESGGRCADRRDPRLFENGRAAARLRRAARKRAGRA